MVGEIQRRRVGECVLRCSRGRAAVLLALSIRDTGADFGAIGTLRHSDRVTHDGQSRTWRQQHTGGGARFALAWLAFNPQTEIFRK